MSSVCVTTTCARSCSGAIRPQRGSRPFSARFASSKTVELELRGAALNELERRHREQLAGYDIPLGDALPRAQLPELFARSDVLINNMEAGAPDKVVYEAAAACLPVLASNPLFDDLFEGYPLFFERESPESLAERLRWFAGLTAEERAEIGRTLRERVARNHSVETWADGILAAAMKVVHLQKVAGISGSEAHLLALLPQLKQRGWDVRFLMLHEHEPGAWDFARELRARGISLDAIPLAADVDPIAFLRIAGYLGRTDRESCTRTSSTPTSTGSSPVH